MGKSDLIDKINARVKSQLSSLSPRPTNRPRADDKDERGGDSGEQRITSNKGTVVVRRRPGPGRGENEAPMGVSASHPSSSGAASASAEAESRSSGVPELDESLVAQPEKAAEPRKVAAPAAVVESEPPAPAASSASEKDTAPASEPVRVAEPVVARSAEPAARPQAPVPTPVAPEVSGNVAPTVPVSRPPEARSTEPRAQDSRGPAPRASEGRGQDGRSSEGRGSEGRGSEGRGSEGRGSEGRSAESRGFEGRGGDARSSEARSTEARSTEGRGGESRGNEGRGNEGRGNEGRGNESRGSESRSSESRSFESRGNEGRSPESRGHDGRSNEGRSGDGRGNDFRGSESRGNFRGPEGRSGDFRPNDARGEARTGDSRGPAERPGERSQDSGRFDRSPRSSNEARVISRPANAPTLEQREARRADTARPGSGMVTSRSSGYESRGGYQEDNNRTVSRSEGHHAGPGGRTEWRPGQDSGLRQASVADQVEANEAARMRPEPLDLEAVLAAERGHVPVKREAQVVGEMRPASRPMAPQGPRPTGSAATLVRPPTALDLEGGSAGAGGQGGMNRRPVTPMPTNIKEIANEDRKKEKAVARTVAPGRPERGRIEGGLEADAFGRGVKAKKPVVKKKEVIQRRDVVNLEGDIQFRKQRRGVSKKEKEKEKQKPKLTVPKAAKRVIRIEDTISVSELSHRMGTKAPAVIKKLMSLGVMATINQAIDHDTASLVAADFGYEVENVAFDEASALADVQDAPENMLPRPPVVTIMGHVDHGKTTLLDAIRDTDVAGKEAGGITQHIGAYKVQTEHGGQVVFLDTPGHEAFTAMRARGAQVTDVVVLVVAADDGVMPQTLEALNHAKAAGVPVLVAVNKIDKPGAMPERIMQKLMEYDLVPEEYGGQTIYAKVSAKARLGIKELLELILLQAEVLDLKANPNRPGRATVIESKLDRGRGPVATVLVNSGTLKVGDLVVVGAQFGKIRAMLDDHGKQVKEAGPSTPVEILGLTDVPEAGDTMAVVDSLELAREVAEKRASKARELVQVKNAKVTLEDLFNQMQKSETKELKLVLKVDVQGSLEALAKAITELSTDAVKTTILHSGVGSISEGDITLASASGAVVIGFNVKPNTNAGAMAEHLGVEIKTYSVIYDALDELKRAMQGLLRPVQQERIVGHAAVKAVFSIPRLGNIAGCMVSDGKFTRNVLIRVQRGGKQIWEGKVGSLRRGKDDVREVLQGFECGIGLDGFNDIQEGDILVGYQIDEIAATL